MQHILRLSSRRTIILTGTFSFKYRCCGWSSNLHQRVFCLHQIWRRAYALPAAEPKQAIAQVILRDYQDECIKAVLTSIDSGVRRIGISLATGSGKTVILTHLIDRVPATGDATQTLILAHRRELVEQAVSQCTRTYPDQSVDVEMASSHASGTADITVASIQSLTSGDRLPKFDPTKFKLLIVDEAHHIVAPQYLSVLDHFGVRRKPESSSAVDGGAELPEESLQARPVLVGVSATFSRLDGLGLGAVIDRIVYHRDYVRMINDQWLSNVVFTTVESHVRLSAVRLAASGDFQSRSLSRVVNTTQTNDLTVRSWLHKAQERRSTLVFCVDKDHVAKLTEVFRHRGVQAYGVTSDTPRRERASLLQRFKEGEIPVILNCGVFTEGTDIPNIDCILIARPTRSRNLLIQMIGRGMRLSSGKTDCHVIDFVSSLNTGVVTAPTLFGLDPDLLVDKASVDEMRACQEKREQDPSYSKRQQKDERELKGVSYTDYDSIEDLLQDISADRHIRAISQFAWVETAEDSYVLASSDGSYLCIQPQDESYAVFFYLRLKWANFSPGSSGRKSRQSPYAKPVRIAGTEDLEAAIHAADTYAAKRFPLAFIRTNAPWRGLPASEQQLDFINRRRQKGGRSKAPASSSSIDDSDDLPRTDDQPLAVGTISKGAAADMITKLVHGAKGRFARLQTSQRARQRTAQREQSLQRLQSDRASDLVYDVD